MQHLRSLISKKSDTIKIKLVNALMSIKTIFSQQNDTKIKDFDELLFDSRAIFLRKFHFQNLLLLYKKSRLR